MRKYKRITHHTLAYVSSTGSKQGRKWIIANLHNLTELLSYFRRLTITLKGIIGDNWRAKNSFFRVKSNSYRVF